MYTDRQLVFLSGTTVHGKQHVTRVQKQAHLYGSGRQIRPNAVLVPNYEAEATLSQRLETLLQMNDVKPSN